MSAGQHEFSHGLHLLRGLCAVGVAAYHYLSWQHGFVIQSAGSFLVYIFFTLSALTMMMVYGNEFSESISFHSLTEFYRRRIARIIPLLLGVSVLSVVWYGARSGQWPASNFIRAFLTGTAFLGLQMPGYISNVVAAWSLGIEAVFYMVFPVVALFASNVRLRSIIYATAILFVCQHGILVLLNGTEGTEFWYRYANPLVFAPFFAIGFIIYRQPIKPRMVNTLLSLMALCGISCFSLIVDTNIYQNNLAYFVLTALGGATVFLAWGSIVPRPLAKIGRVLGDLSYTLYLTHWFSFEISRRIVNGMGVQDLLPIVFAGVAFAIAWAGYHWFEAPVRRLLRGRGHSPDRITVGSI